MRRAVIAVFVGKAVLVVAVVSGLLLAADRALAEVIWIEGEQPAQSRATRHPWYTQIKRQELSGGDLLSNFDDNRPGEAEYRFAAKTAGQYELWVRANPVLARLSYRLNDGQWQEINLEHNQVGSVNIAADDKPDLRFLAWVRVGKVGLRKGENSIQFRMHSQRHNHGYLDCFVLANEPFQPQGKLRPEEIAAYHRRLAEENKGWFAFAPAEERFDSSSGFDLRQLNEEQAGQSGWITVGDGQFVHPRTGKPVRFWAVNGPPDSLKDRQSLRRHARLLAKYGVNLVRVHGGIFDGNGEPDMAKVRHAQDVVAAMKEEGIYTHFSIYFPLWLRPKPDTPWLEGYNGNQHPFAAIYFNPKFQEKYRNWWKALLTTPDPGSGKRLIDEPAVFGVEMVNEDSYFFWTFAEKNLPEQQWAILERQFADWLRQRYGSLEAALDAWKGQKHPRDNFAAGRAAFRPLWNVFNEKTPRDQDTVRFLLESQRAFYKQTYDFLRQLGFKGLITCSNWATASPQVFGPLEKYSYTVGDFIDRHGYFSCNHKGEFAEWSIRNGHTYSDRSALRFEAEQPGKPKLFVHPVMDPHYAGKPSMISETTFCRPNRYRSEAPLYYAAYGALQDSDAIVHFALDGERWTVKPRFFMQQWTLMSPAMMGQFPAAALIYRLGLVEPGDLLVELNLNLDDLLRLQGTPLPQDAALDELRLKDVPLGTELQPGAVIDPLVHYAGRTCVNFTDKPASYRIKDLRPYIDRQQQVVRSTTGQLVLDYGRGVLTINAPAAQGLCGALRAKGKTRLADLTIDSDMELGAIVAVSLDGRPLGSSQRMLLQVISEEKNAQWQTQPAGPGVYRIVNIGQDPWLVRNISGAVSFHRPDAGKLRVTALDHSGYPTKASGTAERIELRPQALYYLIAP